MSIDGPAGAEALKQPIPPSAAVPHIEVVEPAVDAVVEAPAERGRFEHPDIVTRFDSLATLGYVSMVSFLANHNGDTAKLPDAAQYAMSSGSHPVLGYIGACAADALLHKAPKKIKTAAIFAAATVANFATEAAQSVLIASPEYVNFMSSRNLPETAKDYGFSLLGMGLYMLQQRRSMKRQQAAEV